jgi:hypothetical protein
MLLYLRIVIKCSVAQQSNVYVGVWSRNLRPHTCLVVGIDVLIYVGAHSFPRAVSLFKTVCARKNSRDLYRFYRKYIPPHSSAI